MRSLSLGRRGRTAIAHRDGLGRDRDRPRKGVVMTLFDRIGMDVGRDLSVEEAIRWAAANDVRYLDVQTDLDPNALATMPGRAPGIRRLCEETGVRLGLHTLSGVN